jgi:serine/threonine protein kinase HipA of HipAB toxin-antitoxin module
VFANKAEALVVFRANAVFKEEEAVRLEIAGEPRGLNGVEFFVAVVQKFDLRTQGSKSSVSGSAAILATRPAAASGGLSPAVP